MTSKKHPERMPFWSELFLFVWGLVYVLIGAGCWYAILTTKSMEPLGVLILAAVGAFTLWSGGKTVYSLLTDK